MSVCPKCGANEWSKWIYSSVTNLLFRACRSCFYEETKLPNDAPKPKEQT